MRKILPWDEFNKLDENEQRERLAYWRQLYSNETIMNKMGIKHRQYYDLVNQLNLPEKPRRYRSRRSLPNSSEAENHRRTRKVVMLIEAEVDDEKVNDVLEAVQRAIAERGRLTSFQMSAD